MIKQYKLRFYNFRLVLFLLLISGIGVELVGTARQDLQTKQLAGVILGVFVMLILSLIDYSWILNFQWIMYGFNIVSVCVFLATAPTELQGGLTLALSVFSLQN